jgi:hypothetical protein
MSVAVGAQVTCVEVELDRALQSDSEGLPDILIDRLGTFRLKGIPGSTALVQVALTPELAGLGGSRYKESKKAQLALEASSPKRRVHKAAQ